MVGRFARLCRLKAGLQLALALLLACSGAVSAEGKPPREVAQAIDREVEQVLKTKKLASAPAADDAEFLRRVYLDLTGRVPTPQQARDFLDSSAPDKRTKLVDELLASPNYGEQFGRLWRDWIAPAELPSEGNGGNQPIKATKDLGVWFAARFNAGDGWDRIVRQVLTVEGSLKEQPQGLFFSLTGDDQGRPQPAGNARAVASLFLGQQIQCAECHDHPFQELKQTDFWGVAASFRRVAWKFNGRYFESIGEMTEEQAKEKKLQAHKDKSPEGTIAIPKEAFKNAGDIVPVKHLDGAAIKTDSRQPLREQLADWVTSPDNPTFAAAFVNRTWAYLFGRGLVTPIDDLREDNPATHPELLALLASEFRASGYDVRHLLRSIVLSGAYQRTSRSANGDKEQLAAYGRMPVKVMSADVLYDSLRLALADPKLDLRSYDAKAAQRFGESSPTLAAEDEFARLFTTNEEDATDFTHGIPQLLALINHPRVAGGGEMVNKLTKAETPPAAAVEELYLATLSRRPSAEESREAVEYVERQSDKSKTLSGVLWMLLNRSEFVLVR